MTDFEKFKVLSSPMSCTDYRWKEYGDNQPISRDKVFCCPTCGKGRLFEWQLTPFCPHCGVKLLKPDESKEK